MGNPGWEPGRILADRYRLEERIGSGGMGEVWRAEHIKLRSPVAIKLLPDGVAADSTRSARFMREAQAAAAIRSTNVVHVLDYGVDGGSAYIAMEYLEGESLAERLQRRGRLSPIETLRILTQVAKAVGRAHKRGIVHRDLKPGNIFLADEDEGEVVKVLDFGIAKLTDRHRLDDTTQTGAMLGTPYYMSPEQARGHKVVDHRSDLWSLGIMAFECLTGERPMDGATLGDLIFKICGKDMPRPSSVAPVPVRFDAWFAKATRREPEERFQSAKELGRSLRDVLLDATPSSESFDTIDDFETTDSSAERESIEMLDTLAAKKLSEHPKGGPTSDSWDSTGDGLSPLHVDSGDDAPATAGESLRDAAALSRTASTLPPKSGSRRWLLLLGAAAVVGIAVVVALDDDGPHGPELGVSASPQPPTTAAPAPPASAPALRQAADAPEGEPSAVEQDTPAASQTAAAEHASAAPPPPPRPVRKPPAPRPAPKPGPSAPAPSPKIEFGI